jgi:cytidylate kinase
MSFVVTIDGPSAAGKSTVAREVAGRLGLLYVDTGALYRALALKLQRQGGSPDRPADVRKLIEGTHLDLSGAPEEPHVWLDGEDVSGQIRTPEVSESASRLAAMPAVRRRLVQFQQALRERGPLVGEGRDLGTVVFPDAEVKIYLDADALTRARRRARELEQQGFPVPLEQVQAEIERRDERDRTRADSPLRPAPGAIIIESSGRDVESVVQEVLQAVRARPGCPPVGCRPPAGSGPGPPPASGGHPGLDPAD